MHANVTFQGKNESSEWKHFAWLVTINGVPFEYKTGTGHVTPKGQTPKGKVINVNFERVNVPDVDDVLESLFLDAGAGSESFDDFCDNFGYSNDSLKALDTYRACMEAGKKLRKTLGSEYQEQKERIEARNA